MDSKEYRRKVETALKKYYPNTKLERSTRKGKKWMIQRPDGKWIHFGSIDYEDWHLHGDQVRRERFRTRNFKWKTAPKWSPAHLSYWVLW